jgi:hypothetical protein
MLIGKIAKAKISYADLDVRDRRVGLGGSAHGIAYLVGADIDVSGRPFSAGNRFSPAALMQPFALYQTRGQQFSNIRTGGFASALSLWKKLHRVSP